MYERTLQWFTHGVLAVIVAMCALFWGYFGYKVLEFLVTDSLIAWALKGMFS